MSVELIDGPCKGAYLVRRAPMFLRAVKNEKGETDLLDQIEDTPAADEKVFVYQIDGEPGTVHIHGTKVHGWFALAKYQYRSDVDGETLRDNPTWQAWATATMKKSLLECPVDNEYCDRVFKTCCSCSRNTR